jgi:hypothetical protein
MVMKVPFKLMSMVSSYSFSLISSIGAQTPFMPALANTESSRPKSEAA